jgi:hypothetical protein
VVLHLIEIVFPVRRKERDRVEGKEWNPVKTCYTSLHMFSQSLMTKKDRQVFTLRENGRSSIPSDLQDAILRECQTIRNQCAHIYVGAHHEFWRQHYHRLEQYREQVIALVGQRQADEILVSLYFGGRVSKRERPFLLPSLAPLSAISKRV